MIEGVVEIYGESDSQVPEPAFRGGFSPIWQTVLWNGFLLRTGWVSRGFFVFSGNLPNPTAAAFFELRSIGLGKVWLFCVWGPFSVEHADLTDFSQKVRELAKSVEAVFVQCEPVTDIEIPGFHAGEYRHFLEKTTLLLDLRPSEEEILSQMKEKGRYNVRLASKRGVTVRKSDGNSADVKAFFDLLSETLDRDGFSGNPLPYYEEFVRTLTRADQGGLFIAEKDGFPVAAAIATYFHDTATYYYGASTSDNEKRRDMPAYALQWEMMLEGKRRGCQVYDFLWMAPEGTEGHPLAGVTDFKTKFWWTVKVWPESRIMVVKPWTYRMLAIVRSIRKTLKRVGK